MEAGINLTGYDFIVIGIFALFIGRGLWLGLLRQVIGLLSICLGYIVASQHHDRLFPFLKDFSDNPKVVFVASVVIVFLATYIAAMLLGKLLSYVVEITISKWFDRVLGGVLGTALAMVIVILMHMVLGSILAPENPMLTNCQTCSSLNEASRFAREFIRNEDVRMSFMQQKPAITVEDVKDFFNGNEKSPDPVPGSEKKPSAGADNPEREQLVSPPIE